MEASRRTRRTAWLAGLLAASALAPAAVAGNELPDPGGTRTVLPHDDGGRTVQVRGRSVEPRDLSTRYDAEGRIVERESAYTDGSVERMTWDPATGETRRTRVAPDGATTRSRSQADGSTVVVQTGFGAGTVTTETDADGHATRTTEHDDGTSRVETWTGEGPVTTTEHDARGRPTSAETRDRDDARVRTEFDARGQPAKTEVLNRYGQPDEETIYWPGTDVPRRTRVFFHGEVAEVLYYDEDGRLVRRSQARQPWLGLTRRWVFTDGENGPTQRLEDVPRAPEDAADAPTDPGGAARRAGRPTPDVPNRPNPRPGY